MDIPKTISHAKHSLTLSNDITRFRIYLYSNCLYLTLFCIDTLCCRETTAQFVQFLFKIIFFYSNLELSRLILFLNALLQIHCPKIAFRNWFNNASKKISHAKKLLTLSKIASCFILFIISLIHNWLYASKSIVVI